MNKLKKSKGIDAGIVFPEMFTIVDLKSNYPDAVEITLRYRTDQAKARGYIVQLGKISKPVGRPLVMYCKTPITKDLVKSAMEIGVEIFEEHSQFLPTPTNREISEITAAIFRNDTVKV